MERESRAKETKAQVLERKVGVRSEGGRDRGDSDGERERERERRERAEEPGGERRQGCRAIEVRAGGDGREATGRSK